MSAAAESMLTGVRERFPLLERQVNGRPLVYLDSAATTQKPQAVIDAEVAYYTNSNANVHRGLHTLGDEATRLYEGCRGRVGELLGVEADQVTIQRSATSALNLIARGWEHRLSAGEAILVTEMEHHANFVPWQMLAERRGLDLRILPVTDGGELDLSHLDRLLDDKVGLVAINHISNVLGTVNPVAEIAAKARSLGALTVVDAAQSVGHRPLTFAETGADMLVFSAHKMYGPMGLGFLVGHPDALANLEPMEGGGEMIEWVRPEGTTWADIPHRFEAGTPNVAAAAAFPPAIALLEEIGLDAVRAHEEEITGYALERLATLDGLVIYGPQDPARRGGLVSFHDPQVHPHDMSTILDQLGIAIRAGHHCAQPLHKRLGVVATARASFGVYSTKDEVDALVAGLGEARKVFAL